MAHATIDLATAPTSEVAARLRVQGLDLDKQAAALILRDFGGGSLLEWPALRAHLTQADDGWVYVQWRALADAVAANHEGLVYLSSSAHGALELVVALATGRPIPDLGRLLCRFDPTNAAAVHRALSVPLHRLRDPCRELAEWLVSLDDPEDVDGREQRRTVTLDQITARAREALGRTKAGNRG